MFLNDAQMAICDRDRARGKIPSGLLCVCRLPRSSLGVVSSMWCSSMQADSRLGEQGDGTVAAAAPAAMTVGFGVCVVGTQCCNSTAAYSAACKLNQQPAEPSCTIRREGRMRVCWV